MLPSSGAEAGPLGREIIRKARALMSEDSITDRVRQVVARQLKVGLDQASDDAYFVQSLGADSLRSMELIAAFEDEFDIEMDEDEAVKVKTVGGAIEFIKRMVAEQHG